MEAKIKVHRLQNGDEAHTAEFNDGSKAHYHFSGGPIQFHQTGQEPTTVEWDIDTWESGESEHWNAIQEEYARINEAGDDYNEMTEAEYEEWKEAMI